MRVLRWLKERIICLLGFHGYNCKEDVIRCKCSYCGRDFDGWLPKDKP
jgi:hypothetical protein